MNRLIAMAAVLCAARTALAWPTSPPQTPHPAVVRVTAPEQGGASLGSGTLVALSDTHGLVLSNWHVVRDATGPIIVSFPDGFQSGAVVLKTDRTWDLAALAIWRPKAQPVSLASAIPRRGEPLAIAGYGKGSYRLSEGQCTQYVSPGGNYPFEMLEVSTTARQGDSGGPILNGRGELAGVLFGSGFGRTAGSHCGRVRAFLASVWDEFQHLSSQENRIARQPPARGEPAPVAAIGGVRALPPREPSRNPERRHDPMPPGSSDIAQRSPTRGPAVVPCPSGHDMAVAAAMPAGGGLASNQGPAAGPGDAPSPPRAAANSIASAASAPAVSATVPGPTRLDQIKTALAVVGALALLFHGLRLFSALET